MESGKIGKASHALWRIPIRYSNASNGESAGEAFFVGDKMKNVELTHERLKQMVSSDPESGLFTWLISRKRYREGERAGRLKKCGYLNIGLDQKEFRAHVIAWFYMTGEMPDKKKCIDHINQDRADNRWENLRQVTRSQNSKNMRYSQGNKSGVLGVNWREKRKRWIGSIRTTDGRWHIRQFVDFFDAVSFRKSQEMLHEYSEFHGRMQHHFHRSRMKSNELECQA